MGDALVPKSTFCRILIYQNAGKLAMTDIIWGTGARVLSDTSFVLNVTHRKNENRDNYSDTEKIAITSADLPGLPRDVHDWTEESLGACVVDAFLKCEIDRRDEAGVILGKVSHSGVGGY